MIRKCFKIFFCFLFFSGASLQSFAQDFDRNIIVGIAGSEPFVVDTSEKDGISLEIWQELTERLNLNSKLIFFEDVSHALQALREGKVDAVAGPVSITAERAEFMKFSQPYFQSSLSIISRTDKPSVWERITPLFSQKFFIAICIFLFILSIVGALLWLAERKANPEQFPAKPSKGIANGMWCAIVTMTTTGYGDIAPSTFWGRFIAGSWMIISLVFATTMIAGIASTLTLTGMNTSTISGANDLSAKKVATVQGSPAEDFVKEYGGKNVAIDDISEGYKLLKNKKVDAILYDRPQLQYFLQQHPDHTVAISLAEYERQGYGFALPMNTTILHDINVALLELQEAGLVGKIIDRWLGKERE